MKIEEVGEEFLYGWHDQMFETSKRILREEGHLRPYVWMLTQKERVAPAARPNLVAMDPVSQSGQDELAIVCLPLSYDNDALSKIIHDHVLTQPARERYDMAHLIARGVAGYTEERFHGTMVKTFLESQRWCEADLVAILIRSTLKQMGAVAYVKQDDAWHLWLKDGEKRDPNVETRHDPRSTECIISELEWKGGMRVIVQPYHRRGERRGEGKVKSFGDPVVKITPRVSDGDGGGYVGRFTWMLPLNKPTQPEGTA